MISRFSNRLARKIVGFFILCVTASIIVHVVSVQTSYNKKKDERERGNKRLRQELFATPAIIPDKYVENVPNISAHDFNYLMKPKAERRCQIQKLENADIGVEQDQGGKKLLILFMVHSAADHFEHRKTIRETWGSVGKRLTRLVFLLGNPANTTLQNLVSKEHETFGDIVQEDFVEVYRNITLKNIMGLKWASTQCSHAKYVVKADDDMFINTKMLIATLINSRLPRKDLILCKIHFFKDVPRDGKYEIDRSVYSADYWPSFCFGGCWIISMDVVKRLYEMSLQTRQIYLDDVYVTGILRTKLSLPLNYLSRAYMIFCHARGDYNMVRKMWISLQESNERFELSNSERKEPEPYVKSWSLCFK